jgi:hypothetical protein
VAADAALFAKGSALARYKGLPPKTTDEIAEPSISLRFRSLRTPFPLSTPVSPTGRGAARCTSTLKKGKTMTTKTFNRATLRQFTGTEHWYRHSLVRSVLYTDGAKYVAESAGAYWLLDEIALAQKGQSKIAAEEFQVWKLTVKPDQTGTLTCEDGNDTAVFTKALAYTDFPEEGVELYFVNNTILVPSEY